MIAALHGRLLVIVGAAPHSLGASTREKSRGTFVRQAALMPISLRFVRLPLSAAIRTIGGTYRFHWQRHGLLH